MKRFVLSRLAALVPIVLIVSFGTFILVHLIHGNPVDAICKAACDAAARAKLTHQMGLDRPVLTQYWLYLTHLFQGNLGTSYVNGGETVAHALGVAAPVTLELVIISQLLAMIFAFPMAIFSALRPDHRFDRFSSKVSFGLLAVPALVVGPFLVVLFAIDIHLFPATGYISLTTNPAQNLHDMVLPVVTLAIGSIAVYHRILRADLVATFQEDYITMARAKGLPTRYIVLRHALRPSMLTFVTLAAQNIGFLIAGAIVVEFIFGLPGLGSLLINSINQSDYLMVQGGVLVITVAFVLLNLLADMANGLLDPRIRRQGAMA